MKYILLLFLFFIEARTDAQDRALNYFIDHAKQTSPLLNQYRNQILSNQLDSQLLRASLKTQVNLISNNYYAPIINGYGYDEAITNGANVQGLVQASKTVMGLNNKALQYATLNLQNRALSDTIKISEQDIFRTITEQYITAYGDLLTVNFNKELYNLLSTEDTILKKLTQKSVYRQSDYLTFYVTLQQQQLTYMQAEIQYATDYLTLNYLAGIVDTTVYNVQPPQLVDTLQQNYMSSVFYQRFVTDSLRIQNEKKLITYDYKPRLNVYTDGGYNSSLAYLPYKNFGFSAGLNLTIPIYDGHQKQLKYSKTDIEERTRVYNRDFFFGQYNQQIMQLKNQLLLIESLDSKINQQIQYSYTLIDADNKLLETGDIRISDYVTAINTYLNARNLLNQNAISKLRIMNQINYWNR